MEKERRPIDRSAGIKGCHIIYAPKGQAGEYAPLATNPYRGCGHKCAYCYVPAVLRMKRAEFDAGPVPRKDFMARLLRDARKYQDAGSVEQVMLSFTTDPYPPGYAGQRVRKRRGKEDLFPLNIRRAAKNEK